MLLLAGIAAFLAPAAGWRVGCFLTAWLDKRQAEHDRRKRAVNDWLLEDEQ